MYSVLTGKKGKSHHPRHKLYCPEDHLVPSTVHLWYPVNLNTDLKKTQKHLLAQHYKAARPKKPSKLYFFPSMHPSHPGSVFFHHFDWSVAKLQGQRLHWSGSVDESGPDARRSHRQQMGFRRDCAAYIWTAAVYTAHVCVITSYTDKLRAHANVHANMCTIYAKARPETNGNLVCIIPHSRTIYRQKK